MVADPVVCAEYVDETALPKKMPRKRARSPGAGEGASWGENVTPKQAPRRKAEMKTVHLVPRKETEPTAVSLVPRREVSSSIQLVSRRDAYTAVSEEAVAQQHQQQSISSSSSAPPSSLQQDSSGPPSSLSRIRVCSRQPSSLQLGALAMGTGGVALPDASNSANNSSRPASVNWAQSGIYSQVEQTEEGSASLDIAIDELIGRAQSEEEKKREAGERAKSSSEELGRHFKPACMGETVLQEANATTGIHPGHHVFDVSNRRHVEVLLHRCFDLAEIARRIPSTEHGRKHIVGIMGMHGSGTHALREYVTKYFDVHCEPRSVKKVGKMGDGTLELGNCSIWKHATPPFSLPHVGTDGAPDVVLCTVREVQSWMCSLAAKPFELFPVPKKKRPQHQIKWMLSNVRFETGQRHCNPHPEREFESVPALWARYVQGYLDAATSATAGSGLLPRFRLVRYEDIVRQPEKIVETLQQLGLPRNDVVFRPIEHSASGGSVSRADLLNKLNTRPWEAADRPAEDPKLQAGEAPEKTARFDEDSIKLLRRQLEPARHLFSCMDYIMP